MLVANTYNVGASAHSKPARTGLDFITVTLCVLHCLGGSLVLPPADLVLVDREDGGNLVVNPPRSVWERGELDPEELRLWGCLVAATGSAMLAALPQLEGGCINYWEAGNWALNDAAPPAGPKRAPVHRSVHLHLLGRSVTAKSPHWRWGEASSFPSYADRKNWAKDHRRLSASETQAIIAGLEQRLREKYGFEQSEIKPTTICASCSYPFSRAVSTSNTLCAECVA